MRRWILLFIGFVLIWTGYIGAQTNKKVLMLIAPYNFRDEELLETKDVLASCGAEVEVVSLKKGVAQGMLGAKVFVDKTVYTVDIRNYQALVIVGGSGATVFWKNPRVLNMVREAYEEGKIVAAICISPVTLAKAGILRNKKATCWPGVSNILKSYGVIYTGVDVEVSDRIVTASGPQAARAFGEAICNLLGN